MSDPADSSDARDRRIHTSDGISLFIRRYPNRTSAVVLLATHGLQSHHGWYDWSCRRFQTAGYEVWFADRRGCGRSAGDRGHARAAQRLVADVNAVRDAIERESSRPVVLVGICWSAKLMLAVERSRPDRVAALLLLYPALRTRFDASLRQRLLLRLAGWVGLARRQIVTPLRPEHFTDSIAGQQFIAHDPDGNRVLSVAMAMADRDLRDAADPTRCGVPILAVLCGRDAIVRNGRVRRQLEAAGAKMLTIESSAHVLEFEPDREAIFDRIIDELKRRLG